MNSWDNCGEGVDVSVGEGICEGEGCGVGVWVGLGSEVEGKEKGFGETTEVAFGEVEVAKGDNEGNGEYEKTTEGVCEGVGLGFLSSLSPGGNDKVKTPDDTTATARIMQAINFRLNRMPFPK